MNEQQTPEEPKKRGRKPKSSNETDLQENQKPQLEGERVWVSLGTTINKGNFENDKIDVGLSGVPVGASQEYIDDMMQRAIKTEQQILYSLAAEMARILKEDYGR